MAIDRWVNQPFLDDTFPLPLDTPFMFADAQAQGIPREWLARLTRSGQLRRPVKGCYVPAQLPDDLATRAACLRLVVPADAVVVDRHAGWLHGAGMVLMPNEHLEAMPVRVFLPPGRRLRNGLTASGERALLARDITEVGGLRVTTPLRTALDLGRQQWPEPALIALDALHRLGEFTVEELVQEVDRFKGMRWVRVLRVVAPHTDGRSQSGGETVIRWRWKQLRVPPPEPQVEVRSEGRTAFIDVGNADLRAGVEFNGRQWHQDVEKDAARAAWLDRDADWALEWLTNEDVFGLRSRVEDAILDVHERALERARRRAA